MDKPLLFYTSLLLALCSCSQPKQQGNGTQKDSTIIAIDTIAADTILPETQLHHQTQIQEKTSSPQPKRAKQQERYDDAEDAYDDGYAHGWQDGWDDGWHRVRYGLSYLVEPDYAGFKDYYETGYTDGYADGYEKGERDKDI